MIAGFNGFAFTFPRIFDVPGWYAVFAKKDDNLTAGIGGQHGVGMRTKWLRDQRDEV